MPIQHFCPVAPLSVQYLTGETYVRFYRTASSGAPVRERKKKDEGLYMSPEFFLGEREAGNGSHLRWLPAYDKKNARARAQISRRPFASPSASLPPLSQTLLFLGCVATHSRCDCRKCGVSPFVSSLRRPEVGNWGRECRVPLAICDVNPR